MIELDSVGMTLGAAFYGYTLGAALFGITIAQAYQYFMAKKYGPRWQAYIVGAILVLDTLHFTFAMHMMYTFLLQVVGDTGVEYKVVWSLKSMGSVQVFFTIFVQALYLNKIWTCGFGALYSVVQHISAGKYPIFPRNNFANTMQAVVVILTLLAIGVGIGFLIELQKINSIQHFDLRFEYVIYLGFGVTSLVDMTIAAVMCIMLHKSSAGTSKRSSAIVVTLIQYIVGTGLLTSLGALMIMVLYIAWPGSLLYLGVEYSMTRLYAISVLALYNSQARLREKFNETRPLDGASMLYFAQPNKIISHPGRRGQSETPQRRATGQTIDDILGSLAYPDDGTSRSRRQSQRRREYTGDSTLTRETPDTRRPFSTRMFEHLGAEDTLVERGYSNGYPLVLSNSRNGNGRYNTA
ncbi:hypothetical protein BKA70DRAFT_1422895 [Coprinopsis sp. MPI-PUGE-AT-0042]|nr:hypothetical protein BKA70DRAFT_1422895 [Coprinopsis sp. MPI-PUGE-AT-0042]